MHIVHVEANASELLKNPEDMFLRHLYNKEILKIDYLNVFIKTSRLEKVKHREGHSLLL